jgi:hypothetical protein
VAQLELDLDADTTFEHTARSRWIDLAGQAAGDLQDGDGDSMHNSWEAVYCPTCPATPVDVLPGDDNDGDSKTNFEEYQAGTDPNDPLSF